MFGLFLGQAHVLVRQTVTWLMQDKRKMFYLSPKLSSNPVLLSWLKNLWFQVLQNSSKMFSDQENSKGMVFSCVSFKIPFFGYWLKAWYFHVTISEASFFYQRLLMKLFTSTIEVEQTQAPPTCLSKPANLVTHACSPRAIQCTRLLCLNILYLTYDILKFKFAGIKTFQK